MNRQKMIAGTFSWLCKKVEEATTWARKKLITACARVRAAGHQTAQVVIAVRGVICGAAC